MYITEMDFSKADSITYAFINELLKNSASGNKQAHVYERLFGTNTPDGMLNHVRELISPLGRVYHIKGRAGTGKSVFMKKVLHACIRHGLDCELYYCSFDSKSIDMVIVRELDFCIFDSTSPHEFFPEGDHEEIIDLYQLAVTPGTDEKYNTQIQELTANYKSEMKKGLESLKKINSLPLAKVNTIKRDETIEVILDKWGIEQ